MSHLFRRDNIPFLFFAAVSALVSLPTGSTNACGPFFPNQVIANGDSGVLAMPVGDFAAEIDRLRPPQTPAPKTDNTSEWNRPSASEVSATADEGDVREALRAAGMADDQIGKIVGQYSSIRSQITYHFQSVADNRENAREKTVVPQGLPGEFSDYIRGLVAYDDGYIQSARADWKSLLSRPADQRKFRSTWAAFMLGKSYLTDNPVVARAWFAKTRELAGAGFSDSLDLASSSLGWEAKTDLTAGRFPAALALYVRQRWTGDPTAIMSLRDCARAVFVAGRDALNAVASDPLSRSVITAYILSDAGPYASLSDAEERLIPTWLAAVESAGVKGMFGADRLAWAAYRSGDFDDAARWDSRASPKSPIAQWVHAKLLLRDGQIDAAAKLLAGLVKSFPPDDQWLSDEGNGGDEDSPSVNEAGPAANIIPPVVGDLALLRLTRGQYTDSLDLLLRSDYWMDAAYIAERILTVDELKAYVDRRFPQADKGAGGVDAFNINSRKNRAGESTAIRDLLARRLTRLGRWKEARAYYPAGIQKELDGYITGIRRGHDAALPATERAAAFLAAARIARTQGMELLGTELDPDFYCYGGNFNWNGSDMDIQRGKKQPIIAPGDDEIVRYNANAPVGMQRFHYRYVAADFAWSATQLMPDDSDETAAVLYEAGCWLKDRDPKSAERFYKSLVERCPSTALGKAAVAAHWFPAGKPPA